MANKIFHKLVALLLMTAMPHAVFGQSQPADFIVLPNGTLLDERIPLNIADTILRRYEALANGNLQAFRATFAGHDFQDGVGLNQFAGFVGIFFGDMVGINPDSSYPVIIAPDDFPDLLRQFRHNVFHGEFTPVKRNMWASVEKIELVEIPFQFGEGHDFSIRVSVLSYENEIIIHYVGSDLTPFGYSRIPYWMWSNIENLGDAPCCLSSCGWQHQ